MSIMISDGSRRAVPWLQHVYDLMCAEAEPDRQAAEMVAAWGRRTGRALPAAVVEFYTTVVRIPMVDESDEVVDGASWTLPLPELWREFAYDNRLFPLEEILARAEEARTGRSPFAEVYAVDPVPDRCGPLVWFEQETYAARLECFEADGAADPPVRAYSRDSEGPWGVGWGPAGESFSGWLLDWFASFYPADDLPLSFEGPDADWESTQQWPMRPYRSGLWATALDQPVPAAVVAELTAQYGPPARRSLPGGATSYRWRPDGRALTVTTDPPGGGVSAWWLYGDTPDAFAGLLRSVWHCGTLPSTLGHPRSGVNRAEAQQVIDRVSQESGPGAAS